MLDLNLTHILNKSYNKIPPFITMDEYEGPFAVALHEFVDQLLKECPTDDLKTRTYLVRVQNELKRNYSRE